MTLSHALSPRPSALDTIHEVLGTLAGRYRNDEVLTAVRHVSAREAKFRSMPDWVTSALAEAYRAKGIVELAKFDRRMERLEHKSRRPLLDAMAIQAQA